MPDTAAALHLAYYAECSVGDDIASVSIDAENIKAVNSETNEEIPVGEVQYFPSTGNIRVYLDGEIDNMADMVTLSSDSLTKIGGSAFSFSEESAIKAVMADDAEEIFVSDITTDLTKYTVRVINSGAKEATKLLQVFGEENEKIKLLSEQEVTLKPFSEQIISKDFESADIPERLGWKIYAILW